MKKIELLSPVGDFECLKAAVQNGADAVYLGASTFSARAGANNFNLNELEKAINYAKLRNVDVHLALNTLIKNNEFNDALQLAKYAYELGISAIIVQDYGLCRYLLKYLPNLPIHASTQMSIHNLEGAKEIENLGFSRAVLARELSINEIEFIHNNTNIELEVFIHGALCISYSGQCLMSSMIGARSGNRGKCAQSCRLPYELIDTTINKTIDKGYLLSPKDLCGLDFIPNLIDIGVSSLKIEGRLKSPEYVATATKIYRKYIDLALSEEEYKIDSKDKKDLMQAFNRGGFSDGHLAINANTNLICKEKPNNMGIYIGNVSGFNSNKGYITLNLNDRIAINDTIYLEHETTKYRVSELMINNKNIDFATSGQVVKIGRMKGNINPGDKIFKLESKTLTHNAKESYSGEHIKNKLNATITIKRDLPISIEITTKNSINIKTSLGIKPINAINNPITKERIITQISKTGNTPFEFEFVNVNIDDGLYVNISDLNELRRKAIDKLSNFIISSNKRELKKTIPELEIKNLPKKPNKKQISLLLNLLDINTNYSELDGVDNVYIPLKYFADNSYSNIIKSISTSFNTYIYMPNIIKGNYRNLFVNNIDNALDTYTIKGFVLSNIGTINMLEKYKDNYEFIGNYTLNVFNNASINEYKKLGLNKITLSPELTKQNITEICNTTKTNLELIVYGKTPVMTLGYCLLGNANKCYPKCKSICRQESTYYLKDRMGLNFRLLPDNIQTVSTIYNSKITSIEHSNIDVDSVRIDVLDENILEINNIIKTVKLGNRFERKRLYKWEFYKRSVILLFYTCLLLNSIISSLLSSSAALFFLIAPHFLHL